MEYTFEETDLDSVTDTEFDSGVLRQTVGEFLYEKRAHSGCWLQYYNSTSYRGDLDSELTGSDLDPIPVCGMPLQAWVMTDGRLFVVYIADSEVYYVIVETEKKVWSVQRSERSA